MTEYLYRIKDTVHSFNAYSANSVIFWAAFVMICLKSIIMVGFLVSSLSDPSGLEMALLIKGVPSIAVYLYRGIMNAPSLLVYISFIAAMLSFAFLFEGRQHVGFLIIFDVLVSALFIVDLMYYRAFTSFVSPYMLQMYANLDNLGSSLMSMLRFTDIVFLLDIPILGLVIYFSRHRIEHIKRNLAFFMVVLLLSLGILQAKAAEKRDPLQVGTGLLQVQTNPLLTFTYMSPIGYHILDSYAFFYENRTLELEPEEKNEIQQWLASRDERLPDNQYKAMFAGKNLIVIQFESLENFVVNQKIDGQEITPNINKMINYSIYFPNFVEQVSFGMSSDADLMANTSVYPVRKGSTFFRYPYNQYNSLPLLLENLGYSTVAMYAVRGSFWNAKPALESIGFQTFLDSASWNIDEEINMGISDGCYLPQVEKKILEQQAPFYSFVVTLTSHCPFELPDKYKELELPEYLEENDLGAYFQAIHYTDKQVGIFLDSLEKDKLLDDSVIVIYGDHEGVHKYYNDQIQQLEPSEQWWQENNHRVPLIIYQKQGKGEVVEIVGGQIDILPTLSYLMGVAEKDYSNTAMGRNLLKTGKSFAVIPDGTCYGDFDDEAMKKHALQGLEIADMIIRSDYFRNN